MFRHITVLASCLLLATTICEAKSKEKQKDKSDGSSIGDFAKALRKNDWPKVYRNKKGFLGKVTLIGRIDYQGEHQDLDAGSRSHFGFRRFRLGADLRFAGDWRLKILGGLLNRGDLTTYDRLDALYLQFQPAKRWKLTLGKQVPKFGLEWSTPSMDLKVIERSLLTRQIRPRRATGFSIGHDGKDLDLEVGIYSGERTDELGDFNSGFFATFRASYDLEDVLDLCDNFDLNFYYMNQDTSNANSQSRGYGNSYSAAIEIRENNFRFNLEGLIANGIGDRPDVWGVIATSSLELVEDKLDVSLRFHLAHGNGRDGLRPRTPFGGFVPDLDDRGRGERFQSVYLGLNYYPVEDRIHWMNGVQWSRMEDRVGDGGNWEGFTFMTALRYDF